MTTYNNTKYREEILTLFGHNHLLTANDIKNSLPEIDRVTVYRTLKRLTESGIIKEVKHSTKYASYELNTNHQHFLCNKCHQVFPVEVNQKKLTSAIQTPAGEIQHIHLDLSGICIACK